MKNKPFFLAIVVGVMLVHAAGIDVRADWPNFRGPNHDGMSSEMLDDAVLAKPYKKVWERTVGPAFSSFGCVEKRIFTCGTKDKKQILLCMDSESGKTVWEVPFEDEYRESQGGDGTRATPSVHDGLVYILGARGLLLCVAAETGKEVWRHQFKHAPQWGYSGSILIDGKLAVASGGDDDGALVAFNRKTGAIVWKTGGDPVGYATPYPFGFNQKRYIVGFTGTSAIIVEAENGRLVWRMPWKTDWQVNAASPIYYDGHLFLGSGYQTGSALLRMEPDGDKLKSDTVWQSEVLMPKFQSAVAYDGHLYASDQKALKCVDFHSGVEQWVKKRIKDGTVMIADDHLFVLTEDGRLDIAVPTPAGFDPVNSAPVLEGRCWTVPVLHNGRLYLRNLEKIICLDFRG